MDTLLADYALPAACTDPEMTALREHHEQAYRKSVSDVFMRKSAGWHISYCRKYAGAGSATDDPAHVMERWSTGAGRF